MTNDEIIEAARKMGLKVGPSMYGPEDVWGTGEDLYRFADFIARIEREICAKLCHQNICEAKNFFDKGVNSASIKLAKVIRARGQE